LISLCILRKNTCDPWKYRTCNIYLYIIDFGNQLQISDLALPILLMGMQLHMCLNLLRLSAWMPSLVSIRSVVFLLILSESIIYSIHKSNPSYEVNLNNFSVRHVWSNESLIVTGRYNVIFITLYFPSGRRKNFCNSRKRNLLCILSNVSFSVDSNETEIYKWHNMFMSHCLLQGLYKTLFDQVKIKIFFILILVLM
jgi:hypothetical protein